MLDVLIRNGLVVDGTARPGRVADVGVAGGRIEAIGDLGHANAAQVIDATGKVVCPGFVDVHTHYDAQVFWDNTLSPSSLHGITTVFAGNCGFAIAPWSGVDADRDYITRMLARVEGMPVDALIESVPWSWSSTAQYFERIEAGGLSINLGLSAGHSTIRRMAMGPAATVREATDDDLRAMRRLLRAALEAGAIGFSSSRARSHNDANGRPVPSRVAHPDELVALAREVRDFDGTSLELVPHVGPVFPGEIVDLLAAMSAAAQRPINWNVLQVLAGSLDEVEGKLAASDIARARGGRVVALSAPLTFGQRFSFASGFGLETVPGWEETMFLPLTDKIELLRDPLARSRLNALAQRPDNPSLGFVEWSTKQIYDVFSADNEQYRGRLLGEIAAEQGRDPWDALCDIALADELQTTFGRPTGTETIADWKARLEVWRDARVVIGASDAGAHLDQIAAFMYPTDLLERAVRQHNVLGLEEAIHLMTDVPATLFGLRERGRLVAGWHADLLVIDPGCVGTEAPELVRDLPGGAPRLFARSKGIAWSLVNGTPILEAGSPTAARPGKLLRAGTDTRTPPMT